jgi:hypothetical protein
MFMPRPAEDYPLSNPNRNGDYTIFLKINQWLFKILILQPANKIIDLVFEQRAPIAQAGSNHDRC